MIELSDIQWYYMRAKVPVYFAAIIDHRMSKPEFMQLMDVVENNAPNLLGHYDSFAENVVPISKDKARQAMNYRETDCLQSSFLNDINSLEDLFSESPGHLFRANCYVMNTNAKLDRSLVVFKGMHGVIEGVDMAEILRGRPVRWPVEKPASGWDRLAAFGYSIASLPVVGFHHLFSRLKARKMKPKMLRHIVVARSDIRALAKRSNVGQQAMVSGIARAAKATHDAKSGGILGAFSRYLPIPIVFLTHRYLSRLGDDQAVKMKLRFAYIGPGTDRNHLAGRFHRLIRKAGRKAPAFHRVNASALKWHRRLSSLFPSIYPDLVFSYVPFQDAYNLLPPMRGEGLLEKFQGSTILCGARLKGANLYTICPLDTSIVVALSVDHDNEQLIMDCLNGFRDAGIGAYLAEDDLLSVDDASIIPIASTG